MLPYVFSVTFQVCEREVRLHESYFSSSSFDKSNYNSLGNSPHHASFTHDLAWTPADKEDIHQYLQIELTQLMRITKVYYNRAWSKVRNRVRD